MKELPPNVIRILNSCQVITSVASAVKELIENSLDANSKRIDVKLENSGYNKIEIRDNGSGIKRSDIHYAGQPHYTSKISTEEDLKTLTTYGFRGVALGALCAVGDVTIITKTKQDEVSISYRLDCSGKIISSKPSSLGQGTSVIAHDLFKNVPVRRQFCSTPKKKKEEMKKVEELVIAFATIHPEVRFAVFHNHVQIWQKMSVCDIRSALLLTLGTNVATFLEQKTVKDEENKITIDAFLPKLGLSVQQTSKLSRECSIVAVNRRPVRIKGIDKLLNKYYSHAYCIDNRWSRYPICYIAIDISPAMIDLNVEPNKTSVLFHSTDKVLELLASVLIDLYGEAENREKKNADFLSIANKSKEELVMSEIKADNLEKLLETERMQANELNEEQLTTNNDLLQPVSTIDKSKDDNLGTPVECAENTKENFAERSKQKTEEHNPDSLNRNKELNPAQSKSVPEFSIEEIMTSWLNDDEQFEDIDKIFETEHTRSSTSNQNAIADKNEEKTDTLTDDNKNIKIQNEQANWSRGNLRNEKGQIIEPVKIFVPMGEKRPLPVSEKKNKLLSPTKRKKPTEEKSVVTIKDLFNNQTVRRPVTPYALFCQDSRSEVISDCPEADTQTTSKLLMRKWASVSEEKRREYQLMAEREELGHKEKTDKFEEQEAKNTAITSSQKLNRKIAGSERKTTTSRSTEKEDYKRFHMKETIISFNISELKQKLFAATRSVENKIEKPPAFSLVGQTVTSGVWIVNFQDQLLAVNHFRIQEMVEYHMLLAEHYFPMSDLDRPIMLSESVVGSSEVWTVLHSLSSERNEAIGYSSITADKIIANGFEIRVYTETAEIIRMTKCLPFYGITDLIEILQLILERGAEMKLEECRPRKAIYFLQGEAVRNTRITPVKIEAKEMRKLLQKLECLPSDCRACLHQKPFFHLLYDLNEISLSQSQCR